ncbi:MAG: DUF1232 domain-containing protein [Brevinematales bacterium]|nr:DUF1232 domain-containing protein [Brevinematales bacterium]
MKPSIFHNLCVFVEALHHPRCPWYVKVIIFVTVAMAMSPVDLVPDFVPVLGQLDDLLLVPFGIWLVYRLLPKEVIQEAEKRVAEKDTRSLLKKYAVGGMIGMMIVWLLGVGWVGILVVKWFHSSK